MKVKKMELLKDDSSCHQLLFRKIYLYKIVIFAQLVKKTLSESLWISIIVVYLINTLPASRAQEALV